MIKSFACKESEKLFNRNKSNKFPADIQKVALRKLWMIDAAANVNDLCISPNNKLKKLKGHKAEVWSIRINDQWRICFSWVSGNAFDVEIIDYH